MAETVDRDPMEAEGDQLPAESSDRIAAGNLDHTVAAIGRGASIIYHQALTAADSARAVEDFEHEKLATAVSRMIKTLYDQTLKTQPIGPSPYKYLLPFEFSDAWRFYGRDDIREEVLTTMHSSDLSCRLVVLHGDAGMGKTSLLRASIAPALVAEGHLPLLLRVSQDPVSTSVKRSLLPNLAPLGGLQKAPLCEFLQRVEELLPQGKQVYVLLDQFEEFLNLPRSEREHFAGELADCLFSEPPIGHWLISIQSAKVGYLSSLAPTIPQPLAKTVVLPPLAPEQARDAILKPAQMAGLEVEDALMDVLMQDLGGDAIDPSKLQLVCHTLAQSARSGEKTLSLPAYSKAGGAEAILRDHLTLVLQRNLPPEDAEIAWRALAVIADHPGRVGQDVLISELKRYQVAKEKGLRVLEMLEINRLIRVRDQNYWLTSPSLLEPIRKWKDQQAALEQARIEAQRQFERVRNSALRGLFGGGLAFVLAFVITYSSQAVDRLAMVIVALFEGLLGGVGGIVFTLALDIARASFHGRRRWMQILWSGAAGAVVFAAALVFHILLSSPTGGQILLQIRLASVEGGLWGLVAGVGTAMILLSTRPLWQTMPLFTVLSALALWVGEGIGKAYHRPRLGAGEANLDLLVLLAGALMFLALAGVSLLGQRKRAGSDEPANNAAISERTA